MLFQKPHPGQHTWRRLFQKHTLDSIHDECYSKNAPWTAYTTKVIPKPHPGQHTWRRLFQKHTLDSIHDDGYPKNTPWTAYMTKVIPKPHRGQHTWRRLFQKHTLDSIHDEGNSKNTLDSIHDEGYSKNTLDTKLIKRRFRKVFFGYSGFLQQYNWPPRYSWNIVESGALNTITRSQRC